MPTWIPSAEAFGAPKLAMVLGVTGTPSAEAFGTASVTHSSVTLIQPVGIPSAEAMGTPALGAPLLPVGIPSAGAFGTPTIKTTVTTLLASGTATGQGQLLIGQVSLAGTVTSTGTLTGSAVGLFIVGGAIFGSGQLVWYGPLPLQGSGGLLGFMELLKPPPPICPPAAVTQQAFSYMQPLGKGGLSLCILDGYGNNYSPMSVSYALYQVMPGGYKQLRGPACRTPVMTFCGCYYATGSAGECGQPGEWAIIWTWQRAPGYPCETRTEGFRVLDAAMANPCDPNRKRKFGWGC